jgi:hypothetical protein
VGGLELVCFAQGRVILAGSTLRREKMRLDPSSGLNSVKRILNDTAAKAKHFTNAAGKNIISVALLSGVFKVESLMQAQQSDLFLVWSHDLDGFVEWIKTQT